MKPIIVGQALARDSASPFEGRSGQRLARLCYGSEDLERLRRDFELTNLLDAYPGRSGAKGDAFPRAAAQRAAEAVLARLTTDSRLILCGKGVARAFNSFLERPGDWPYFQWKLLTNIPTVHAVVVPHPSGVNRWWNEHENEVRANYWWMRQVDQLAGVVE